MNRLRVDLERLTEEVKQLDHICQSESNHSLELTSELSELKVGEITRTYHCNLLNMLSHISDC